MLILQILMLLICIFLLCGIGYIKKAGLYGYIMINLIGMCQRKILSLLMDLLSGVFVNFVMKPFNKTVKEIDSKGGNIYVIS